MIFRSDCFGYNAAFQPLLPGVPGTELFDHVQQNGFITNQAMSDEAGHQMAHIEYPGLPVEYVLEMVHKFYDEYFFRPQVAFRIVWQAIVNRDIGRL